jgi:hypothetical protein
MLSRTLNLFVVAVIFAAAPSSAEVVRIDVQSRSDLVGGPFGAAGPYEKPSGKIFFAVDPVVSQLRIDRIATIFCRVRDIAPAVIDVSVSR